jgi:hypothetical protein
MSLLKYLKTSLFFLFFAKEKIDCSIDKQLEINFSKILIQFVFTFLIKFLCLK